MSDDEIRTSIKTLSFFVFLFHNYNPCTIKPHNLPMTLLGAGLLWFGRFGFNAGSALAANGLAASAFVATHVAGATGTLAWLAMEWKFLGKPTTLGAVSGATAGLATITPAAGFISPLSAAAIGIIAGVGCFYDIMLKNKFDYDDSLDVVGIRGNSLRNITRKFGSTCGGGGKSPPCLTQLAPFFSPGLNNFKIPFGFFPHRFGFFMFALFI